MTVIALDFDGVLCDSVVELAWIGYSAASTIWPTKFLKTPSNQFVDQFIILRPVIETGFESIILTRLINDGMSPQTIRSQFKILVQQAMDEDQLSRHDLINTFGKTRDQWIRRDSTTWLALHKFYAGISDTLHRSTRNKNLFYIITTKEKRFAEKLVKEEKLGIPSKNIFGLKEGRKSVILLEILHHFQTKGTKVIYIDDRWKTLEEMDDIKALNPIELFLATWGYNTPEQKKNASHHARIKPLNLPEFLKLLL